MIRPKTSPAGAIDKTTVADRLFQRSVIVALCLEIVVFIEPAPVDIVIAILLVIGVLLGKLSFREITPLALTSLALFASANFISMGEAYNVQRAIFYVGVTLYLVFSWLFFIGLMGRYGISFTETMIRTYCFAGFISAFLGVAGYFHLVPFYNLLLVNGRASGFYKDCNVYGPYFVPIVLIGFVGLTRSSNSWGAKALALLSFGSGAIALLLSFSRAAWINCCVALALLLVAQFLFSASDKERRRRLIIGALLLGVSGALITVMLAVPAVSQMLTKRVTSTGLKDYDRVRFATQQLALATAIEHPLGIGPGQSEEVLGYATHSTYMRLLSENGFLALFAFFGFVAATLGRALTVVFRAANPADRELNLIFLCCIIGHLVNSSVVDTVHWRNLWFICAVPWAPYVLELSRKSAKRLRSEIPQLASNLAAVS